MSTNRTHRTRLARALAAVSDIPYQTALTRVVRAAEAGLLPDPLDAAGMRHALDLLAGTGDRAAGTNSSALALESRYYRMAQVCGDRMQPGVPDRVARARAKGVPAVRVRGSYDPVEILGAVMADQDDPDAATDWWQRVVAAGTRDDCALTDPYPPGSDPDGYLPIDRALDRRDATGDVDAYERTLRAITRREPRDIDAHAHLGNLYLDLADPTGTVTVTPPPDARQRQVWLRTALGHYQTAVGVAELALPEPFTGFLPWAELDNRPFSRAMHGLALTLWRLSRFDAAEQILLNMLWLNPMDNQGARMLLGPVREGRAWADFDSRA
ncbi:hypothetical protein RB614_31670 [Phytohabitans sp. ZYX-F-186]|uniref:Tetratricopeptide repeat protein n=1 Tax=Phytohabitans maris TaxID=3071409 RepID=A0ABU0ZPX5_9ACTN|nr:hypothetical protein [Phytohabitans sp. ZYX-F-186]MDQ7909091.1 hypothetical protein [Phytohabitans sp. ZYX-F-186]